MIYVMRHGESTVNVGRVIHCKSREGDLTDLGREQADKAGQWLVGKDITKIRCSSYARAMQTAAIVGDILNIEPVVDEDLGEVDCGDLLDGSIGEEAWQSLIDVYEAWIAGNKDAYFPGGETFQDLHRRFSRGLARVDQDTLVVAHGGIMRAVIPYLCVNAAALQKVSWFDNTGIAVLDKYNSGQYNCLSWNLREHLDS